MSALTKEQIAALPGLVSKANDGPWELHDATDYSGRSTTHYQEVWDDSLNVIAAEVYRAHGDGGPANMRLIALAPSLAATVIEQQAEIERLRGELDWIGNRMVMSMALNKSDLIRAMKSRARAALEVKL